ncbi:hypothetical protein V8C35DRAFT_305757 [Trichoderma chlorosporum]
MPVTTRPSPSKVGKNKDREVVLNSEDRTLFNIVASSCDSPYINDPRQPGAKSSVTRGIHDIDSDGFPIIAPAINPEGTIIASSIDSKGTIENPVCVYSGNGFIQGLIRAFNQDLHLVIRPDDVWQAIISQFSHFVNGNAERLRHMFVAHEGKRELIIDLSPMSLAELDFSKVAQQMTSLIQKNVVDAELRQWMMPEFSTTTDHDKAVAAFGMMGAMQQYFGFKFLIGCGLPSVTLLGTRHDWEMLANRINKLEEYGEDCKHWASLLQPIMRYMLRTFDEPDSQEVKDFWLRIAYEAAGAGSGGGTLSGWITAFAYFKDDGTVTRGLKEEEFGDNQEVDCKRLILDGVSYPPISSDDFPTGLVVFPVTIVDYQTGVQRFSTAVAGTIGMSISGDGTTSQPLSAWWIVQEYEEPLPCEFLDSPKGREA